MRPISRGESRRESPPATRIVTFETPRAVSSSTVAAIASCRGSGTAEGSGRSGWSVTTVAVPPRVTGWERGAPRGGDGGPPAPRGGDAAEWEPAARGGRPQHDPVFGNLDHRDACA